MNIARTIAVVVALVPGAVPFDAQWLNHPTPDIPRTSDGKPNLAASAPRGADGHPDLSGVWTVAQTFPPLIGVSIEALTAESKALIHEREENFFRDRPAFRCQPNGPEAVRGWRRVIQTPSVIAIAYDNLTYRLIFTDGRRLEANPERTWMGYSVGHWEGETLVVESFGFNDRTWLDASGLPHTEALRTTERYRRRNFGQVDVELTVTDSGAFAKPWTVTYNLAFQADTEMVEAVCEDKGHWIGRVSDLERGAVTVSPLTLAKYVGVYRGLWGTVQRTVRIELEGGALYSNGVFGEKVRLIPHGDASFVGTDGLSREFDSEGSSAAFMVERHVSGDWRYSRQP